MKRFGLLAFALLAIVALGAGGCQPTPPVARRSAASPRPSTAASSTPAAATVATTATPGAILSPTPTAAPAAAPSEPSRTRPRTRDVADEPSAYGKLVMTVSGESAECHVSVSLNAGNQVPLFVVPDCSGDVVGMNLLAATQRVGSLELPFVAPNGDEFHVFDIATARGGNATGATDYWVAVVRPTEAWGKSIDAEELSIATHSGGAPAALVLEQPATTTDPGQRYAITFRSVKQTQLPKLPSSIRSRETRDLYGELNGGFHYTNWHPVVLGEGKETVIDDKGRCALPQVGEQYGDVAMKVEITTWSDGRTDVKCLSFERLKPVP